MIDPDTLKQAVELAPGWELSNNDTWIENYKWSSVSCSTALVPDYVLDYLAAELVRLVDAIPDYYVSSDDNIVNVMRWSGGFDMPEEITSAGTFGRQTDRTANTINAICQFAKDNPVAFSVRARTNQSWVEG